MLKIGTHDSVTGEKSYGFLSYVGLIFAKCQSKTIKEQYDFGCRYFDIRTKKTKRGWICAHGLWQSKRTLNDILQEINNFNEQSYVQITYEGEIDKNLFLDNVNEWIKQYPNIIFTMVNIKKPTWQCIKEFNIVPIQGEFIHLDFTSWHTLIPIPWLWKKIYYNKPSFNENIFKLVDFL